jgi:hypothetical protein
VLFYILVICKALIKRGLVHDNSKFSKEEFEYVYKLSKNDKDIKFGSKEYYELVDSVQSAKIAHYTRNSHHPDHYSSIYEMSLLDMIEMLGDWKAATKRKNGNILESLEINSRKYNIGIDLKNSLHSTIKEVEFDND